MARARRPLPAWRQRVLDFLIRCAPVALSGSLWLLSKTIRIEYRGIEALFDCWKRGERVIVAFWHNRSVLMPLPYRGEKMCIMNSQHRDGEIATRALARWGIRSVRGSATRGGVGGFLQLVDAYRNGYDLAVVPDGPRGPKYVVKPGVVHLAKATGARVFPVAYGARWKTTLRSWDRLIIPLPFSRIVFIIGEPMAVDRHADDDELARRREDLEASLHRITAAADAAVGA